MDTTVLREVLQIAKEIPGAYARSQPVMQRRYVEFFFKGFLLKDRRIVQPVPTEFFATLVEFRRVRTKGGWQPHGESNSDLHLERVPSSPLDDGASR